MQWQPRPPLPLQTVPTSLDLSHRVPYHVPAVFRLAARQLLESVKPICVSDC